MATPWPAELQGLRAKFEKHLHHHATAFKLDRSDVEAILDEVIALQEAGFLRTLHMGGPRGEAPKGAAWFNQAAQNLLLCRKSGTPHVGVGSRAHA